MALGPNSTGCPVVNSTPPSNISWQDRAESKRRNILASIPQEYVHSELSHSLEDTASVQDVPKSYLTNDELDITSLDVITLLSAIASKRYSAAQVLNAFTHRAAIAHKLLHCSLDMPYPQALRRAKKLDSHLAETGKTIGPLHGLPISVKDQIRVRGTETTCGFIWPLGQPDTSDAVIVKILQDAGAIVFAKTSLPMGCMWGETVNNILGRASNPFNRSFSCGGSSGGEGGLIGFRGSPLGIGSDLGGSIRSPSCYQGLYGLRPSSGRLPYYGFRNGMDGQSTILSVTGPMCRSIDGVELFTKTIVEGQPWLYDPQCQPIPWKQELMAEVISGKKLRIGVFDWDGVCLPQPPIRNAMREVTKALRDAGHETIPWKMNTKRAVELVLNVFRSDAAGDISRQCLKSGEPMLENGCQKPEPPLHLLESWDLAVECLDFRAEILRQWNATATDGKPPMDVFLSPIVPAVAPRHGDYSSVRYFAYTAVTNLLDYTSCTFPVRFVDPAIDFADDPSLTKDASGEAIPAPTCQRDELIRRKYDPETYKGLPITLQVVGRRLEEEKVIGVVKMVSELLRS